MLTNVDLEYIVDYDYIKENIIVKVPRASYDFSFRLNLEGMYATLLSDGSVGIYSNENNEMEYAIPAPYMYDADGTLSEDVTYELAGASGKYILTVSASEEWINAQDRAFPVTIDPSVVAVTDESYDSYICTYASSTNYGSSSILRVSEDDITYIRPSTSFTIPEGYMLSSAALSAYYFYGDDEFSGEVLVGAYQVKDSWTESGITWDVMRPLNNYGLSTTLLDEDSALGGIGATVNSPELVAFDITGLAHSWLYGTGQYGIGLRYLESDYDNVCFKSYESGYDYRPRIVYEYSTIYSTSTVTAPTTRTLALGNNYAYSFTPSATGKYSFWTTGTANTNIYLFTDATRSTLIEQRTDGGHYPNACLTTTLTAGEDYYIVIHGKSGTTSTYTFKLYRGLPMSGSEQPARINEFNSTTYQAYNNCYTYALNLLKHPLTDNMFRWNGQNPGEMAGATLDLSTLTNPALAKAAIEEAVRADCVYWGGRESDFYEVDEDEIVRPGYYKVALVLDTNEESADYHWYRQASDLNGGWAHKIAWTNATTVDSSNNPIYVPSEADTGTYTVFLGYYAIKSPA